MDSPPAVKRMSLHVLTQLLQHRTRVSGNSKTPLIVGVQGPQGSGKTYLATHLRDILTAEPHNLSIALLSIDDLYWPHDKLVELAQSRPLNALLKGRGQPGTHDVSLGTEILNGLRRINEPGAKDVVLPIFEKSLHGGEGDRLQEGLTVKGPIDVVIIEGWCIGFCPISPEDIDERWARPVVGLDGIFSLDQYRKEDIIEINGRLREYIGWWTMINTFIQIKPVDSSPYVFIYKWRLQQEREMKARNGGKGMTDDQVISFVNRYIPGYVFFSDGLENGYVTPDGQRMLPSWIGNGLKITIGEQREVVEFSSF